MPAESSSALREVVREGVVVVDDEHHWPGLSGCWRRLRRMALSGCALRHSVQGLGSRASTPV